MRYWVNDKPVDRVEVGDRGLHYGDGVFETIPIYQGSPLLLDAHIQRMEKGCERLQFRGNVDAVDISRRAGRSAQGVDQGVMKIIVTRGAGARGYRLPDSISPTCIIGVYKWPDFPKSRHVEGVDVRLCAFRLSIQPRLAGIKHLNRLEQVLARAEWQDEWHEGLMLDEEGIVIGGTMSNVFVVLGDTLLTPLIDRSGVRGILRDQVLGIASTLGIKAHETRIQPADLFRAKEVFLTNSVIGIWPVRTVDTHRYLPGAITRQLQATIHDKQLAIFD